MTCVLSRSHRITGSPISMNISPLCGDEVRSESSTMKLRAQIGDREHELSLRLTAARVTAEIAGRRYEMDLRELPGGVCLLIDGTKVYRCRVDSKREPGKFEVVLRGHSYDVTVIDPKRLRSGQNVAGHGHGAAEIVSPMPGKVVRVLVEMGVAVEVGAGIMVVEAMKMQNEMKSPKAGVVVSINAKAGATVNAGDVLAVIE
jgi:biotin carboxyl carrier protein